MPIAPLMPTALPLDAAEHHNLEPDATRAYNVCRDFEEHAAGRDNDRNIMHARILGYLIIYSPSLTAQREVVKVIHSCCNDHASLSALGSAFLDYYISPCERSAQMPCFILLTIDQLRDSDASEEPLREAQIQVCCLSMRPTKRCWKLKRRLRPTRKQRNRSASDEFILLFLC